MSSLEIETERVCACIRERERELAIDRGACKKLMVSNRF